METRVILDGLTKSSVSVRIQKLIVDEGVEYAVGEPHRRAYVNSASGRQAVQDELSPTDAAAILSKWGDTSTVSDEPQN